MLALTETLKSAALWVRLREIKETARLITSGNQATREK